MTSLTLLAPIYVNLSNRTWDDSVLRFLCFLLWISFISPCAPYSQTSLNNTTNSKNPTSLHHFVTSDHQNSLARRIRIIKAPTPSPNQNQPPERPLSKLSIDTPTYITAHSNRVHVPSPSLAIPRITAVLNAATAAAAGSRSCGVREGGGKKGGV